MKYKSHRKLKGKVFAVDTETTGLDPYQGHRIYCAAYFTDKGEHAYFRTGKQMVRWFRALFNDPEVIIIFHNAKFDLKMFMAEGIDVLNARAKVECTLTMSKVLESTAVAGHALEVIGPLLLGRDDSDKLTIKNWCKNNNTRTAIKARGYKVGFKDAPEEMSRARVLWDVETTLLLYYFLSNQVDCVCPDLYETERRLIRVCVDMEDYGVMVDITRARALKAEAMESLVEIQDEIDGMCLPIQTIGKKKGVSVVKEITDAVKITSGQHMVGVFEKLGIELVHKTQPKRNKKTGDMTGGGNWCFDEYAMVRYVSKPLSMCIREAGEDGWSAKRFLREVHKVVKKHKLGKEELIPPLVLRYRQLAKMVSTYYNSIIEKAVDRRIEPNGREVGILHCSFNPATAATGRFSCSSPNLQNIPRIMGPRECFITRPGRRNWHLDYSQVEMRFFCHFAEDREMAAAIDSDVHEYVATKIYRKPRSEITKEQRKRAKATNFGIIYGSGAKTQAETLTKRGLPTSEYEAKVIVSSYHREFPKVRKMTSEIKGDLARDGYIENPFGRRYVIPLKFAYKGLNYKCQGTSADLIKQAMVDCWEWLRKNGFKTRVIMTVHDEIVFEIPRSEEQVVVPMLLKLMERLDDYFVPIIADAEVTPRRWSEKKDPVKDLGLHWLDKVA